MRLLQVVHFWSLILLASATAATSVPEVAFQSASKWRLTRSALLRSNKNDEIVALEKSVIASAQARVDFDRVLTALEEADGESKLPIRNDLMYDNEDLAKVTVSHWQIASAAAAVTAGVSFLTFQNYYLSIFLMGFVFVTAAIDDDTLSGALARILGRSTIQSVQASQPRIKALARAVVTGKEEIAMLKQKISELEEEAASLRLYKVNRIKADEALPRYTVSALKELCKQNALAVGGTKSELMLRLLEAKAISLD